VPSKKSLVIWSKALPKAKAGFRDSTSPSKEVVKSILGSFTKVEGVVWAFSHLPFTCTSY
jgi:hypothetical protein